MNDNADNEGQWLKGKFVFLSASKPSRNLDKFPLAPGRIDWTSIEIEEAVLSLARAVFSRGGRLVFGGHPSISPLVASVAAEYFPARSIDPGSEPVWIFQSKAFERVIPKATTQLQELGYARIFWTDNVDGEHFLPEFDWKEQCLESLKAMRRAMIDLRPPEDNEKFAQKEKPIAMVAIGGMEGVLREARLFLERTSSQVYVLRSTEGAAGRLFHYLRDNFLEESNVIETPGWKSRITTLEEIFPAEWKLTGGSTSEFPLAPYAVLMQLLVMRIAGKNPGSSERFSSVRF